MSRLTVGLWQRSLDIVELEEAEHRHPIHVVGVSGMGKSVLLGNLALQWQRMGEGVLLIDVKDGQLAADVAARADADNTILVCPGSCYFGDADQLRPYHWGLNVVELPDRKRHTVSVIVDNLLSMFERMDKADYSIMTQLRAHLDNAVRLALYDTKPTLLTIHQVLVDQAYRTSLRYRYRDVINPIVEAHWKRFDDNKQMTAFSRSAELKSTLVRIEEIITPPELQYMVGQYHSTIEIGKWLDQGTLVIVDCATGMSPRNAELLGNLIMALACNYAFTRPRDQHNRFVRLVCDEFHKLAGNNFAELIELGRYTHCLPVMAHQNLEQLKRDRDKGHTLANAVSGVPIAFRLRATKEDRRSLRLLLPEALADDLGVLAKHTALLEMADGLPGLVDPGTPTPIALSDWWEPEVPGQYDALLAAQQPFTRPERELRRRMETSHDPEDVLTHFSQERPDAAPSRQGRTQKQPPARGQKPRSGGTRADDPQAARSVPEADRPADIPDYLPPD